MALNNIKNNNGFTIVELLVVIVIIGILAAITIVSYTGITVKASTTKATSNADIVQNVVEAYNAANGYYPDSATDMAAATTVAKLPSGVYLTLSSGSGNTGTPDGTNGTATVLYQYCGATAAPTGSAVTGGRIQSWDFGTKGLSAATYFGTGAAGLGVGVGTVCNTWVTPAN